MGVDKSYGSGYKNSGLSKASALKPGRLKKAAPAVAKARTLTSRAAAAAPNTARDKYSKKTVKSLKRGARDLNNAIFGTGMINGQPTLESGVSPLKLSKVIVGLSRAGRVSKSLSVADRLYAKVTGRELGKSMAIARKEPIGAYNRINSNRGIENLQEFRGLSRDVFPKRLGPGKSPGSTLRRQARNNILASGRTLISPVRGTINPEGYASLQKLKAPGAAPIKIQKQIAQRVTKGKRVAELEKRLNFPGKAPKRGGR